MTTRDFTPRTARWAEDASFASDPADVIDPLTAKQNVGFLLGEHPARTTVNWILRHHGVWSEYLQQLFERVFDGNHLLRGGDEAEGEVTATYNGDGTWDLELTTACYGWADGEAFLCEAATVTVDPTGTGSDSAWFIAVATKTGFAVRVGADAASPVRPTLLAGDVALFEIQLADGTTATSEQADLRNRGRLRAGLLFAENRLRAGDDGAGGWLLEVDARSALTAVRLEADVVAIDSANSTVVDGQTTTLRADGNVTIESDGGGDVNVTTSGDVNLQGRTVRPAATERRLNVPAQVLQVVGSTTGTGALGPDPEGLRLDSAATGAVIQAYCPIHLPEGSTITRFKAHVTGDGAGSDYEAHIVRQPMGPSTSLNIATVSGSGSGDLTAEDAAIPAGEVLDDHAYAIHVVAQNAAAGNDLVFHGFEVAYVGGEL